jgi:uncharacterized tellurite resistance protein B-like protein
MKPMSLITRLRDLFQPSVGSSGSPADDESLTVAILLTLVAHADGRVVEAEEEGLRSLLTARCGLSPEQASGLIGRVRETGAAIDPATTLVDRIVHDVGPQERPRLLSMAYRIAAADGKIHGFEDDLIWRTGRLLGFSDEDLAVIKAEALESLVSFEVRG